MRMVVNDRLPIRIWRDADVSAADVEHWVGVVRLEEAVDATVITRRTEAVEWPEAACQLRQLVNIS